ncbi:MAG: 16S rRNA (adenine(1518)-N(6)/adenine(1519)-N(6))-dimethyltransferase RsmA [Bacteroidales bacterium]|nr:16S rRNA (adenine(1518)-N(6)/adenine(1519)-N(6))-dimethyltransferase RsmA [Bacteroidales bacterium]
MYQVRAKKHLGQHFLKDEAIAKEIAFSLSGEYPNILEIGPGMGVLTKYLFENPALKDIKVVEIDRESVEYLNENFPNLKDKIYSEDFLKMDIEKPYSTPYSIIGNFPYNISSQILFRVFENRDLIPELVGMFQKEVAQRICSKCGTKVYGILSVLLSAYYDLEYLFTVEETAFLPPPKVKSAVIRMKRNEIKKLDCDEKLFITVVKTAFNQRRKMLRQSLKPMGKSMEDIDSELLTKRAEQLTVEQFVYITNGLK